MELGKVSLQDIREEETGSRGGGELELAWGTRSTVGKTVAQVARVGRIFTGVRRLGRGRGEAQNGRWNEIYLHYALPVVDISQIFNIIIADLVN